jgi:hypothetical protein
MIDPATPQLQYRQRLLAVLAALDTTTAIRAPSPTGGQPGTRRCAPAKPPTHDTLPPPPLSAIHPEQPTSDGLRNALVARVRGAIAAGYYDHPAIWLAAENALLDKLESQQPPHT